MGPEPPVLPIWRQAQQQWPQEPEYPFSVVVLPDDTDTPKRIDNFLAHFQGKYFGLRHNGINRVFMLPGLAAAVVFNLTKQQALAIGGDEIDTFQPSTRQALKEAVSVIFFDGPLRAEMKMQVTFYVLRHDG